MGRSIVLVRSSCALRTAHRAPELSPTADGRQQLLGLDRQGRRPRCPDDDGQRLVGRRPSHKRHLFRGRQTENNTLSPSSNSSNRAFLSTIVRHLRPDSIRNTANRHTIARHFKKAPIKKEIKIVEVVSGRQISCRRWVMENNPQEEGRVTHPYNEEVPAASFEDEEDEEQASYAAHELSMIEEVSSDAEQSGLQGPRANRTTRKKSNNNNQFSTRPSDEDDVFADSANILHALRAGNQQYHNGAYQQVSPSGRIVQRRYTGGFRLHDEDDFSPSPPRQAEASQRLPSTFTFELPTRTVGRTAQGGPTPTQSRRHHRGHTHASLGIPERPQNVTTVLGSPLESYQNEQSHGSSEASTLRMDMGMNSYSLGSFYARGLFSDDEHSIQDDPADIGIYGYRNPRSPESNESSLHTAQSDGRYPEESTERMMTPHADDEDDQDDQEHSFETEIMGDHINVNVSQPGSWETASEVSLPPAGTLPQDNIANHQGPFEWSPGKQQLLRREGSLSFQQQVDTPLLVPTKSDRKHSGPYGFGDNIYPEDWVQAGELGEGLYPPGNHHGLSDPFSSSSVAVRDKEIVEGVAGLKVTVMSHSFTPEALRCGQPNAQAVAHRNRLASPFYNRLQELAGNSRRHEVADDTFDLGARARPGVAREASVDTTPRSQHTDVLPEAVESPTAHVIQDYQSSSEIISAIDEEKEPSPDGADSSTRNEEVVPKLQSPEAPATMGTYTLNTRDWADYGSALVEHAPEKTAPKIPGCTAGQAAKKDWKLTGSTLHAYNAMRGSRMVTGDPLGTWIAVKTQEGLMKQSPEGKGKDKAPDFDVQQLQNFAADIAETLQEWPSIDKQGRQEVASVPRPQYQHLNPPEGFKYPAHLASSINGIASESYESNFKDEYDISDDEGEPRDGRISPCTFRALAEGCTRWDDPAKKLVEMPPDAARLRPTTPSGGSQPRPQPDRMTHKFTWQRDADDGDHMSPAYTLPSSPSIIYTPPGLRPTAQMNNWSSNMYDRMDPLMAKRLRDLQTGAVSSDNDNNSDNKTADDPPSSPPTASSENRAYTQSEVAAALTSPQSRPLAGVPPDSAELVLSQRWQAAGRWRADEEAVARRNGEQLTPRLATARAQLRAVRAGVDEIVAARKAESERRVARQNRRILRQVSGHLREVRYQLRLRAQRLGEANVLASRLEAEIAVLEGEIRRELERVGLEDVAAVRAEVGEEFWSQFEGA